MWIPWSLNYQKTPMYWWQKKTVYDIGVKYKTHVQNIGWQDFVTNGAQSGTMGKSLRLETIQIELTGGDAGLFDIYYQVHAQNVGWMGWAKNGNSAGTEGLSYRLEAYGFKLYPRATLHQEQPNIHLLKINTAVKYLKGYFERIHCSEKNTFSD